MYCTRKVTDDIVWVGGNDRRLKVFEGVYEVPRGVSYNSYLILDEKTVLMDTVDRAVSTVFFENIEHELAGRKLDYVVVQHMEPDHSATLAELVLRHPEAVIVCNSKLAAMIKQYFDFDLDSRVMLVKEGDVLETGRHRLTFVMAPMVHWPEVMVTFDTVGGLLFSADAFGTFGAIDGALFADEVDFEHDHMDEARRYYCNIVGKYGTQVNALLKKASALKINMILPLHGFVWRRNIGDFVDKYVHWASYTPEEKAVVIAYASVYGNTANAAEMLSCMLRERSLKTYMFDVSSVTSDYIIASAFRCSHLVFASTTYNAGIFVKMEELLHDLAAHNIQNRTVAFIENGSWAATSGKLMREIMGGCKNMTLIERTVSLKSSVKPEKRFELELLADEIAEDFKKKAAVPAAAPEKTNVDPAAFNKLSYGLFVLTAREGYDLNGCIINTAQMLTDTPKRITIAVNKANLTHDMIMRTGEFNVSVLTESVTMKTFEHFGFSSGRDKNKFETWEDFELAANGVPYITKDTNAFFSAKVTAAADNGTHTLFTAEVTEAAVLSSEPSVTYAYYFAHIKPKKPAAAPQSAGWVCRICGFVYEGDTLPENYECPICKHGPEDFERIVPAEKPKGHKWVCEICGFEYEGEELPASFTCPLCKHGVEDFRQVY
ncbi:MAG: flavin reductase [Clostridiales bacterium]|nr:flavin reductase [Clostridiales bacterium]